MADSIYMAMISALWLGILTSISPCPLATNIAAVSFIGKNIEKTSKTVIAGISYAIGRTLVYIAVAAIAVISVISIPALSHFLQTKINIFLGPLLIITGMILLDMIKINLARSVNSNRAENLAKKGTLLSSLTIGILFALAFCPVSAALFFGSLIPIAVKHKSIITLPGIYGLGTALPVIFFAVLLAVGAHHVSAMFKKITVIEFWIRRVTGVIFILVGVYFCIVFIFKVQLF